MRHAIWALLLATGCFYGESVHPEDYPQEEPGPEGADLVVDHSDYRHPITSELGTEKVRPIAKTVEWPAISTTEGTLYAGGSVVVDKIHRNDSDDEYGVRVRLKNTSANRVGADYLVRFTNKEGATLSGYLGTSAGGERWTPFVIAPYGYTTVTDFSRVIGAQGFTLLVRGGGSGDGAPYVPKKDGEE